MNINVSILILYVENSKLMNMHFVENLLAIWHDKYLSYNNKGTSSKAKKLSVLIGFISSRYAKIFNKKYGHKGSIFEHSFIKFPKQYEVWQIDTIFYILNNPLEANMCKRHNQYPFTSYKLHIGAKTSLSTIIKIDNSLIEKHFADADDFKKVLKEKLQYQRDVAHIKYRQSIE